MSAGAGGVAGSRRPTILRHRRGEPAPPPRAAESTGTRPTDIRQKERRATHLRQRAAAASCSDRLGASSSGTSLNRLARADLGAIESLRDDLEYALGGMQPGAASPARRRCARRVAEVLADQRRGAAAAARGRPADGGAGARASDAVIALALACSTRRLGGGRRARPRLRGVRGARARAHRRRAAARRRRRRAARRGVSPPPRSAPTPSPPTRRRPSRRPRARSPPAARGASASTPSSR